MNYIIQTERLVLRPPTLSDEERLFELMSNPKLTTYLTWEAHTKIETTKTVIQGLKTTQEDDKGYHWCVCLNNKIIGIVSLIDVRRKIRTWALNRSELSYWIAPENQGKGYATEAAKAAIDFGFKNLNFHKIIVAHAGENIESKRICDKLGFVQYAHEHDAFKKSEKWYDLIWYELIV